jgi:epoxyqueuosine reductase
LGSIGRNCLLMLPGSGSAAVLGVLLLPFDPPDFRPRSESASSPGAPLSELCEACGACVDACPTGALRGDGSLERKLCLQHWSSVGGDLPASVEAAWADQLYGCDICQEVCPVFRPDPEARTDKGLLGPGLPIFWLESASEGEVRAALKGSALGMGWISVEALKRNARHLTRHLLPPTMKKNGGRNGNL